MTDDSLSPALAGADSIESRTPGATVGLTCWWACVITAGLAVVAGVVSTVMGSAGVLFLMIWLCVALLTWVVGWPAGWLAEWLLGRAGVAESWRVTTFAVLGAVLAIPIVGSGMGWSSSSPLAVFAVAGALGAGGGRWIVARRARRRT